MQMNSFAKKLKRSTKLAHRAHYETDVLELLCSFLEADFTQAW
jgi:hypothetical protein